MHRFKHQTQTTPKRLIYFSGHPRLAGSKMITRVYADYETVGGLFNGLPNVLSGFSCWSGECASRTLSNLYNLHACRGLITSANIATESSGTQTHLQLETSMSGPHHYLGHIDPCDYISVYIPEPKPGEFGLPIYTSYSISDISNASNTSDILAQDQQHQFTSHPQLPKMKTSIPTENILTLSEYWWISGKDMTTTLKKRYGTLEPQVDNNIKLVDTQTGSPSADSLFPNPGVLELGVSEIRLQLINPDPATNGGVEYDFSGFGAQLVPNSQPWRFNQAGIQTNKHAQHKLRLITYYYGQRYVNDYLMRPRRDTDPGGSGLFIERHEFIQAITPINRDCGGFVILGRELKTWQGRKVGLELISVQVPFGFTLLVEPWAIHGDSNLTGLYSMAMTGNHLAMQTADTVFLKNHNNTGNVRVVGVGVDVGAHEQAPNKIPSGVQKLLLTSEHMTYDKLETADTALKVEIRTGCSWLESWYYNPVIWAPRVGKKILASLADLQKIKDLT
jgi:hypothetical protein